MKPPAAFLALALAGCASDPGTPARPAESRVADLTLLRLGQPHLDGALEVTRFRAVRDAGPLRLVVGVTNRTGAAMRLRWRFRYVDADGWERRSADSAAWKEATIGAGEEWTWSGEAEAPEAVAAGMDWRYVKE
jgi:hypothetical protein